jgi:hypothetical protein
MKKVRSLPRARETGEAAIKSNKVAGECPSRGGDLGIRDVHLLQDREPGLSA